MAKAKAVSKKAAAKKASQKEASRSSAQRPVVGEQSVAHAVLVRPLITEKSTQLASLNTASFVVAKDASKSKIAQAVFEVYGVKPEKVRTMNYEGKTKRFGRSVGKRSDWKKAIVFLPEGSSISIHPSL